MQKSPIGFFIQKHLVCALFWCHPSIVHSLSCLYQCFDLYGLHEGENMKKPTCPSQMPPPSIKPNLQNVRGKKCFSLY